MSDLKALDWYFKNYKNMIIADSSSDILRCIGFTKKQLDLAVDLDEKIIQEASGLMKELDKIYNDTCRNYICTAEMPKRKRRPRFEFSYKILHRKKTKKYKKVASVTTELGLDMARRPALVLYMYLPDAGFIKRMKKEYDFNAANNKCGEMWGTIASEKSYLLGTLALRKGGGALRSKDEIKEKYGELLKETLFFGKNNMIGALEKAAA